MLTRREKKYRQNWDSFCLCLLFHEFDLSGPAELRMHGYLSFHLVPGDSFVKLVIMKSNSHENESRLLLSLKCVEIKWKHFQKVSRFVPRLRYMIGKEVHFFSTLLIDSFMLQKFEGSLKVLKTLVLRIEFSSNFTISTFRCTRSVQK